MPSISIVTPVLNGERYIAETIRSVQAQTYTDWEYLIVDGGSTDRTPAIVRDIAASDARIRYVCEPDQGMYDGLFKGLERSSAPLCCWINADDQLMPWAFEAVTRYRRATGAEWVTGIGAYLDARGVMHSVAFPRWYPRKLIRLGLFHGRCLGFIQQEGTFFSRALLNKIDARTVRLIRSQKVAGDFLFWTALSKYAALRTLPTVLAAFRMHSSNASADQAAYYREISRAGYVVLPGLLARLAAAVFDPISHAVGRQIAARWRRLINSV